MPVAAIRLTGFAEGKLMSVSDASLSAVPASHRADLERAVLILTAEGCSEIYVFGSVATGSAGPDSDLDIGVRGCPKDRFFSVYGQLLWELEHGADLIDFDSNPQMLELLDRLGEVCRVA